MGQATCPCGCGVSRQDRRRFTAASFVHGLAARPDGVKTMAECLHCEINKLIDEHIAAGPKPVDLAEMVAMVAQSLGELLLAAPKHEQANLMADSLAALGATFLD